MIRRDFLLSTAAVAAGTMVNPLTLSAADKKIKLGILGTGWWGTDMLLQNALATGLFEIVALCDVESTALNNAAKVVTEAGQKKPQLFSSYRELYEVKGLEAVAIATPTYWHPLHFIHACEKGLDVFLEKPISYDIRESQAMLAASKKAGNVVQVDFPRMMVDTNDQVKKYIQSGEIGEIYQVKATINSNEGALVEKEIPNTMDFETFCGPAPKLKYLCNKNANKPNWRAQHDFSRGILVDWGIHYIMDVRSVLDLDVPNSVSAIGGITRNTTSDNPDHLDVRFEFDGLPVYWSHKTWGYTSPNPDRNIGIYYYGEKATIFAGDLGWEVFFPGDTPKISNGPLKFDPYSSTNLPIYMKMIQDLFRELAQGMKDRSNEGITNTLLEAQKTTSTVIYGDMAYRAKSELEIDTSTMDIMNNEVASGLLKRSYRAPYEHPYKA